MNDIEYQKLCNACDDVLLNPDATIETIAIPWLHILNEHPANLEKYEGIFRCEKVPKFGSLKSFVQLLKLKIFDLNFGNCSYKSNAQHENVDVLFISHLLNNSQIGQKEDFYFGLIPDELSKNNLSSLILLIDHTDGNFSKNKSRWDDWRPRRLIFGKTLTFSEELRIRRNLQKEASRLRNSQILCRDAISKKVILHAASQAMTSGSIGNMRLYHQLKKLIENIKPKAIVLTYEGHGWERIAFLAARDAYPGIKCYGYQHTIMFPRQHATGRLLGKKFDPDVILMSGKFGFDLLECNSRLSGIEKIIIGSHRKKQPIVDPIKKFSPSINSACLVIPDGTLIEAIYIITFTIQLAKILPAIKFIIRLHPVLSKEELSSASIELSMPPSNVEYSTEATIEKDFYKCRWALYRGSSAVIYAVTAGLRPFYISKNEELSIDPLVSLKDWRIKIAAPAECRDYIFADLSASVDDIYSEWIKARNTCASYFNELNCGPLVQEIKSCYRENKL